MKSHLLRTVCIILFSIFSVSGLSVSAQDYYITGQNVNGHEWELSTPDCGFADLGNGVYEWTGKILESRFNINDGTWSDGNNTFGSNGSRVVIGKAYKYASGNSVGAFLFDGVSEVVNPKVTLDVIRGTILVESLGDENPDDPEKPFENEEYAVLTVNTENGTGLQTHLPHNGETVLKFDIDGYWMLSSVTENGRPVSVSDNQTSLPVKMDSDKTINVRISYREPLEWVDVISGMTGLEGTQVTLGLENGALTIEGLERGTEVVIYTLSGQTVGRYVAAGTRVSVSPGPGNYVVRVASKAVKITL